MNCIVVVFACKTPFPRQLPKFAPCRLNKNKAFLGYDPTLHGTDTARTCQRAIIHRYSVVTQWRTSAHSSSKSRHNSKVVNKSKNTLPKQKPANATLKGGPAFGPKRNHQLHCNILTSDRSALLQYWPESWRKPYWGTSYTVLSMIPTIQRSVRSIRIQTWIINRCMQQQYPSSIRTVTNLLATSPYVIMDDMASI